MIYQHLLTYLANWNSKENFFGHFYSTLLMMFVLTASSTTELRPVRSASDLSSWSVDDVARYIADADSALTPYSELFRKHVCTTCSVLYYFHKYKVVSLWVTDYKPSSRLLLLCTRPAVTFPAVVYHCLLNHTVAEAHTFAFLVAGSRLWNSMPPDITSATTLTVFRNRLKTYLFSRPFSSWLFSISSSVHRIK